MVLTPAQRNKLLDAIEADNLVLLCGAGLSIPEPSKLISAVTVAQRCYDARQPVEPGLDPAWRTDIDQLAAHFHANNTLEQIFIDKLVPWDDLVGLPNPGHAVVADLLLSGSAHAALSANFDPLIETWAEQRKVALQGALNGQEAIDFLGVSKPLLKFHGCFHRDKFRTLWTHSQLPDAVIQQRVTSCSQWMNLNLPGKDLLIVGFWTDWGYLNDVLATALEHKNAHSVTVVDPDTSANLTSKAPLLWQRLNDLSQSFEHIPASGADALQDLRLEFSKVWARRFYALGAPQLAAVGVPQLAVPDTDTMTCDELYDFRRDAEGVSAMHAARRKAPQPDAAQSAIFRLRLLNAGATKDGAWLGLNGERIRIINGGGRVLSEVQGKFDEPSSYPQPTIAACIGAQNLGVHPRIIPEGRGSSIVRPAKGGTARWLSLEEAEAELGL